MHNNTSSSLSSHMDNAIKFCDIISFIYAIITFCFFIILIISTIKQGVRTSKQILSFNMAIICVLNAITYLMPDPDVEIGTTINKSEHPLCFIKALIHLGTVTGTVNITFLCYFMYYVELKLKRYSKSICFQTMCYVVNWLIIGVIVLFYGFAEIHINELKCCRFRLRQTITTVNTVYSAVVICLTFVMYFVLRYHVKTQINQLEPDEAVKTSFRNAINYFVIVVLLALIKLMSFFLNTVFPFRVVDRIFENLYGLILFSLLGIGKENIYQLLCPRQTEVTRLTDDTIITLD